MRARFFTCKRPMVFDGAMGTTLISLGLTLDKAPEYLNISKPEVLEKVLKAFVDAGSQVVQTNTFGANRIKLAKYGLEAKVEEINRAAVTIARKVAGDRVKVAVSVGPTGKILEPWGSLAFDEAIDVFKGQITAAILEKPDLIIIETMTQIAEARAALLAAKSVTDIPIIATMAFEKNLRTAFGSSPEAAAIALDAMGADMVGINCVGDFDILSDLVKRMAGTIGKPVMVQPNAGSPKNIDGDIIYPVTAEVFAEKTLGLVREGAIFVGGCCGTTPDHIRALSQSIKKYTSPKVPENALNAATSAFDTVFFDPPAANTLIGKPHPGITTYQTESKTSEIIKDVKTQREKGAKIVSVDLNVFRNQADYDLVKQIVLSIQKNLRCPICFEGGNEKTLDAALKYYQGRAILKMANGHDDHRGLYAVAKKYGALVLQY